ncbi:MAG: T9SS type A sorting domain-containing protein [Cyclobacteriaceae bacterium]
MNKNTILLVFLIGSIFQYLYVPAQNTQIDVNLDINHVVGGISEFDRSKFITVHAVMTGNDWNGEDAHLKYLFEDLDVHMGRDNGAMPWQYNQANEDPSRPGYVDPEWMASQGQYYRETVYGQQHASRHQYEGNQELVIGGQNIPFWPGSTTNPCCGKTGWDIAGSEATGDFMGRFVNEFFRDEGQLSTKGPKRPKYLEIINEPLWHFVDQGSNDPIDVFNYHNTVADGIRVHNQEIKIGGYTAAFPIFEENNFKRWEERMKLFMDHSGDKMDFFSLHFYDFDQQWISGWDGPVHYKGGRLEATFDMIEQYSHMKRGSVKPMYISEYGGRDLELESDPWTPYRDWVTLKAMNSLMMQFMERPDVLIKTIPFIVTKAEWGRDQETGVPYGPRLLRQNFENPGDTGDHWVFTNLVQLYEFWQGVNGTRVDTYSTNPNIMVDAYVKGNTAYIVLNNLGFQAETVDLNLLGDNGNTITAIETRHLHLTGNESVIDIDRPQKLPDNMEIGAEASVMIKCTFTQEVQIDETSNEEKYYADTYYQPIAAGTPANFNFNNLNLAAHGEAVLRIGVGRDHGKSLRPVVKVNGTTVPIPAEYRGDDQNKRPRFFGMLEVPLSYDLLQSDNTVSVEFGDSGGHISSVVLQTFGFTREVARSEPEVPVAGVKPNLNAQVEVFPNPTEGQIKLVLPAGLGSGRVQLKTLGGKILISREIKPKETSIDLGALSSGIYVLTGKTEQGIFTKKINIL